MAEIPGKLITPNYTKPLSCTVETSLARGVQGHTKKGESWRGGGDPSGKIKQKKI